MHTGYGLARAALVGNPSDGCYGRTIAVTLGNFRARAVVSPSERLEIRPGAMDEPVYESLGELYDLVRRQGYYGGYRLIVALLAQLREYCGVAGIALPDRNFTVEYETTIPVRAGLGGSSAILTATLRAVLGHYGIRLPRSTQAHLVWEAERRELGLAVGPQDRVAQAYEGLVAMDFGRDLMERWGYGRYERLEPRLAGDVYVAYRTGIRGVSQGGGGQLAARWRAGEREAVAAMSQLAALAGAARQALVDGDREELHQLIDANLDVRMRMGDVDEEDAALARVARRLGASANLAGPGGAIAGLYEGPEMLARLREELGKLGAQVERAETAATTRTAELAAGRTGA